MNIIQNSSNFFIGTDIIEVERIKNSIIKNGQTLVELLINHLRLEKFMWVVD